MLILVPIILLLVIVGENKATENLLKLGFENEQLKQPFEVPLVNFKGQSSAVEKSIKETPPSFTRIGLGTYAFEESSISLKTSSPTIEKMIKELPPSCNSKCIPFDERCTEEGTKCCPGLECRCLAKFVNGKEVGKRCWCNEDGVVFKEIKEKDKSCTKRENRCDIGPPKCCDGLACKCYEKIINGTVEGQNCWCDDYNVEYKAIKKIGNGTEPMEPATSQNEGMSDNSTCIKLEDKCSPRMDNCCEGTNCKCDEKVVNGKKIERCMCLIKGIAFKKL